MDKISNDVRVYTDVQGLENLRAQSKTDPNKARKEVAQQFESLLFQMVMRSMRDANNALASDLFSSNDMSFYQDMFDKQLSLALSTQGVGFAQMIETNLDQQAHAMPDSAAQPSQPIFAKPVARPVEITQPKTKPATITANKELVSYPAAVTHFNTPRDFMNSLWGSAKRAAKMIGVHPSVLMAQAALETNWGKKIIGHIDGASTHNLFNIKSDPAWAQKSATTTTLEQKMVFWSKKQQTFVAMDHLMKVFQITQI